MAKSLVSYFLTHRVVVQPAGRNVLNIHSIKGATSSTVLTQLRFCDAVTS